MNIYCFDLLVSLFIILIKAKSDDLEEVKKRGLIFLWLSRMNLLILERRVNFSFSICTPTKQIINNNIKTIRICHVAKVGPL